MLDLATVRCEQFAACLNQDFQIVFSDGTLVLQLSAAHAREAPEGATRDPFTLTFRGAAGAAFAPGHLQDDQRPAR